MAKQLGSANRPHLGGLAPRGGEEERARPVRVSADATAINATTFEISLDWIVTPKSAIARWLPPESTP